MQPQLCCFIMCDDVQSIKGKYSLIGIFYRIHAQSFPCMHNCNLVVGWYGDEGQHSFGMRFVDPEGQELQNMPPYSFSLSRERPYYNVIIKAGLPLRKEGIYWFEVFINGDMCGRFPVHVDLAPAGNTQ